MAPLIQIIPYQQGLQAHDAITKTWPYCQSCDPVLGGR